VLRKCRCNINIAINPRTALRYKGLAVYTNDTKTSDLELLLGKCNVITKVGKLGVMVFCPDGDDKVRLHPNSEWKNHTNFKSTRKDATNQSYVGIGGK